MQRAFQRKKNQLRGENKTTTVDTKMCKGQKQSGLQATPKEVFAKQEMVLIDTPY